MENRPQFDGRFFVKIYNDEVFKNNIVTQAEGNEQFTTLGSRKIYGISADHVDRHTKHVGRYLVDGNTTSSGSNHWDDGAGNVNRLLTGTEHAWGYYLDDVFSSYASYFRRYKKGVVKTAAVFEGSSIDFTTQGDIVYGWTGSTGFNYKQLIHLKPGGNDIEYLPHDGAGESTKWQPADNWIKEFGKPSISHNPEDWNEGGQTAFFRFYSYSFTSSFASFQAYYEGASLLEDGLSTFGNGRADNPKDTDVWFIDRGPWKGIASTNHLDWPSIPQDTGFQNSCAGIDNDGNITAAGSNNENWLGADDFRMMLGFGGIEIATQSTKTDNFFNVGDWHVALPDAANTNYGSEVSFVGNFNIGSMFRWKEDPDKTIYIISGNPYENNFTRHSLRRSAKARPNCTYVSMVSSFDHLGLGVFPHANNTQGNTMAESLSFNFTKNWTLPDCKPLDDSSMAGKWNPDVIGAIPNGLEVKIAAAGDTGTGGPTSTGGNLSGDLKIFK